MNFERLKLKLKNTKEKLNKVLKINNEKEKRRKFERTN